MFFLATEITGASDNRGKGLLGCAVGLLSMSSEQATSSSRNTKIWVCWSKDMLVYCVRDTSVALTGISRVRITHVSIFPNISDYGLIGCYYAH